jgi:pentapeptide MXKDX repeat protein
MPEAGIYILYLYSLLLIDGLNDAGSVYTVAGLNKLRPRLKNVKLASSATQQETLTTCFLCQVGAMNMSGAVVLRDVMLRDVVLRDVVLRDVMLRDVMLRDVMFRDVMLRDVMLRDVVLRDVMLRDFVLRDVMLRDVVLRNVIMSGGRLTVAGTLIMDIFRQLPVCFLANGSCI